MIIKIKLLDPMTKDLPERKAGQLEGSIVGISITIAILTIICFV